MKYLQKCSDSEFNISTGSSACTVADLIFCDTDHKICEISILSFDRSTNFHQKQSNGG